MNQNKEEVTNTINKFLEKANVMPKFPIDSRREQFETSHTHGPFQKRGGSPIKGASGYVPVQILVHRKDGTIIPAIRWKSFSRENLVNVRSRKNLIAVRNVSETPAFTRFSSIKQTMFFLANEMDIESIYDNEFLPRTKYEFFGEGIYLYNSIETAQKRAEELKLEVLPVKVDVNKAFSTKIDAIKSQNLENIKTQGYSAIVLMKNTAYEFDLFCFDSRDIVIIGEDNLTEDVKKSIENYELQDAEGIVAKEYLDTLKCTLYEDPNSEIEKSRPKAPPLNEDGTVNYDKVNTGESIWVTVTEESSPLHGRPIILTKRPDGLFALTGGAGSRTDSMRHLIMEGKPKKTKADEEFDKLQEEEATQNEPFIEQRKELMKEGKQKLDNVFREYNNAINISETDKQMQRRHREELIQMGKNIGVSEDVAKSFATCVINHETRANRETEEKVRRDTGLKINKLRRMGDGEISEEDFQALNEELIFKPIKVDLPSPKALEELDFDEINGIIGGIYDEKLGEIYNPNPLDKNINSELEDKGIIDTPIDKDSDIIQKEIGSNIKPLVIKDIEQLKDTFKAYEDYYSIRREINRVERKIKKINITKTTPIMIEKLRTDIRGVLGENLTDAEIEELQKSYNDQHDYNNSAISFYKAVGEFWNDENAIRHSLSRIDNGFGGYVNYGAISAIGAITGTYLDKRMDVAQLIDKTSIETANLVIAFDLRDKFKNDPNKYDLLIKRIEEYNSKNQIDTEKRALKRHEDLKQKYETIEESIRTGLLAPREKEESHQSYLKFTEDEIENLIEQKKNLGIALGSMQASASFLNSLIVAKNSKDEGIYLNFGADQKGAELRLRELNLTSNKAVLDNTDPNNIQLMTNARSLTKYMKSLEVTKDIFNENEKIKNDDSDTYVDEEGSILVDNYKVPLWKKDYVDNEGVKQEYKNRVEQRNDIEFLKKMDSYTDGKGGGVITRVTGTGKTNTALGFFANKIVEDKNYSAMIIVPKGRSGQWVEEAKKFTDLNIVQIPENTTKNERAKVLANIKSGEIGVISQRDAVFSYYDLESIFSEGRVKGLVLDEPQEIALKGRSGNMSATIRKIMRLPSENRIALTATPARDNLIEAYDLVNWVSHRDKKLGPRTRFQRTYGGYGSGTNAQDVALAQMLHKEISPYVSGDKLTNPKFKINKNEILVNKTEIQNTNMRNIEANSKEFIETEKNKYIDEIQNNPNKLERMKNKYGNRWKVEAVMQSRNKSKDVLDKQHEDNLSGITNNMTWKDNPKINNTIENIIGNNTKKHIIFIDNRKQREALMEGLLSFGYTQNQIENIASSTMSSALKGSLMSERVKNFRTNKNSRIIFIDKQSSSGYNLQEADDLHVLGTPSDAATYLQAQGRLARMPRKGDVTIHTYKYRDNIFEDKKWIKLEQQLAILRATAPGLFPVGEQDEGNE